MAFLSRCMSCLLFLQPSPPPAPKLLPRNSGALDLPVPVPVFIGVEIDERNTGNKNESSVMAGDLKLIDGSRSESMVSEVSFGSEDGASLDEEGISQNASPSGRRRRRRDVLKKQIKDISKQIKQGRLHLQEEGEKHLQVVVASINRQAQEFNQSRKFRITPSLSSHDGTTQPSASSEIDGKSASEAVVCTATLPRKSGASSEEASILDADEKLLQEGSATIINDTTDALDSMNFLPCFIGVEIKRKIEDAGDDNESSVMASDSKSISDSRSESMLSEVSEEGASVEEEGISNNTSPSQRRGRRNLLKNPIKGISRQIKQGRLHLQEEGEKHLQTVLASINRQVEEVDQSGKFRITPSMSKS